MRQYINLIENIQNDFYPIILGENISEDLSELIKDYIIDNSNIIKYSFKRDNCGVVSKDFSLYSRNKNFNVEAAQGKFKIENLPSLTKKDLTDEEYKLFIERGYDINNQDDIIEFSKKEGFYKELFEVPHYWNEYKNIIIDFSAEKQFLQKGMISDINKNNYIRNN